MSRKSTQKANKGRPAGKHVLKDLSPQAARAIKGGKKAYGTGGGNVAGGWDLTANKVHS